MKYFKYPHPFLFAVFPILYLFSHNIEQLYNSAVEFLPLLIALSLVFSVSILLSVYLINGRNWLRASIFTSFFLVVFYSYGYVFDFLHNILGADIVRHRYVTLIYIVAFFSGAVYILLSKRNFQHLNTFLNVTSLSLFIISVSSVILFSLSNQVSNSLVKGYQLDSDILPSSTTISYRPDIYYIILDGYADSDILNLYYDFDNSSILEYLNSKGFYMAYDSTSNYGYTYASLASSLNMQYLDRVVSTAGADSNSLSELSYLIENNAVVDTLKTMGYTYIHFSSGYPMTNFNHHADISLHEGLDRFSQLLLHSTMLRPVTDPMSSWRLGPSRNDVLRQRILFELNALEELPRNEVISHPRFVFTHIVSPHQPFIFDSNGNAVDDRQDDSILGYRDQVAFLNMHIRKIVDSIIGNSTVPPVIIIQSDHGANPPGRDSNVYKFNNFTAVHMGDISEVQLNPGISPVNIFRVIFNGLFGTELSILEKKNWVTSTSSVLDFKDVSDEVRRQQVDSLDKL